MRKAVVIDMGIGNLRSLVSALDFLGVDNVVGDTKESLQDATHIILPGVGAFDPAMSRLHELGIIENLRASVIEDHKAILGICLGMQLLCSSSEEGEIPGLGLVSGRFQRLIPNIESGHKVPHVGFSEVTGYKQSGLFEGLTNQSYFYFTHSYALGKIDNPEINIAYCSHAHQFVAAFQHGRIAGAQFHPEKSQSSGLRLIRNFIANV